ncbi:hypothetical protein [Streptomyces sp. NBC_00005]|uniref:hypothetical protein n=1 Tax=Streptomyces sp. NBC_00005 TaxID=2903609 RepID=UPI0032483FB8
MAEPRSDSSGRAASPSWLDAAVGLVRDFGAIITNRPGATLPAWTDAVDANQLPGLTGFALQRIRDLDVGTASLALHRSSVAPKAA